jgi:hypothetical protein
VTRELAIALRCLSLVTLLLCRESAFAASSGFGFAALPDTVSLVQGTPSTTSLDVSTQALAATALPAYPIVLSPGELPAGITASFSALSITNAGSATLTLTADGTTPAGSYLLEIDAGTVDLASSGSALFTLTVLPAPDFALAVTPAVQSVVQGVDASYSVTASALDGFTDSVDFAVTGQPAGTTAVFTPATIAGSGQSTLTIGTSAATAPGDYALTLTGTSGALQHSLSVQLSVSAPVLGHLLSVTPGSQSVPQGATASYVVSTLLSDGSSAPDTNLLTVSGLPAGAAATFNPAATASNVSSTLSVATSPATPPGSYVLTVESALAPAITLQLVVTTATATPSGSDGDVPLPDWALALLAAALLGSAWRRNSGEV